MSHVTNSSHLAGRICAWTHMQTRESRLWFCLRALWCHVSLPHGPLVDDNYFFISADGVANRDAIPRSTCSWNQCRKSRRWFCLRAWGWTFRSPLCPLVDDDYFFISAEGVANRDPLVRLRLSWGTEQGFRRPPQKLWRLRSGKKRLRSGKKRLRSGKKTTFRQFRQFRQLILDTRRDWWTKSVYNYTLIIQ